MPKIIEAVFDGEVLRPVEPVPLKPHTRVRITLEATGEAAGKPASFLQTARSLNLEGPADWSARLNEYLYGNKRPENS
jgi:predicted DNA-binding antitoxin AbrB/MazE fold protein